MATKFLANLNLSQNELQNARIQNLTTTQINSITPVDGQIVFDTTVDKLKYYNGTAWVALEAQSLTGISGTAPIQVSTSGNSATISIDAADSDSAGSMSSAHYNLVDGATNSNTVSTIVKRDSSGNFSAGTITANLTGTASDADKLDGEHGSYYLSRANHTGSQTASTISDFNDAVQDNRLDQLTAPTSNVSFNSQKITGLADPTDAQDAATKAYVDATRMGLDVHGSVRAATTGPVDLSTDLENGDELDGVTLATGNRVLVKNQSTGSENGIYVVQASGAAVRATDADENAEVTAGFFVFVEEGSTNADSGWVLTTNNPITVNLTALSFAQFSGAGQVVAGAALTKSGNTLDVAVDNATIEINSDALRIKDGGVGAAKLAASAVDLSTSVATGTLPVSKGGTGVATFTAGFVKSTGGTDALTTSSTVALGSEVSGTLPVANGGTGATTAAGAKTNLGFMTRYSVTATWTAGEEKSITHNLGTKDVVVSVYDASDYMVIADTFCYSGNVVKITCSVAGDYRVVVIG